MFLLIGSSYFSNAALNFRSFHGVLWYFSNMPPKASKQGGPSKKTEQKKKEKIIEDKTFGLKNKKGAKTQKFIQQVQHQVKYGQQSSRKLEEQKKAEVGKTDKKKENLELNQLFKPVATQKVEKGADPKSVLCVFFKQGHCAKGDRCKFSHDLNLERKAEKRSVYVDMRDDDNMDSWDEEKLKEVVNKKHAEADLKMPKTDIICKYFVDALERSKYGWFWECPNGEKCIYRHALPPGFVLNKDKKKEDKKEEISIEELVEKERINLGNNLTKVTLESFLSWKKRKQKEQQESETREDARKKAEFKAGKLIGLSGREMFTFRPEMATEDQYDDDETAMDTSSFSKTEENTDSFRELTLENILAQATEVVTTPKTRLEENCNNHIEESLKLGEASGGSDCDIKPEDVPIDEDLFAEDDENLEELEENLENLDMNA